MFYEVATRVSASGLEKLLSLVTFFAAAKKVTLAPGRGALIDRHELKQSDAKDTKAQTSQNAERVAPPGAGGRANKPPRIQVQQNRTPTASTNTHAACFAEGNRETNRNETVNPSN